LYDSSYQNHDDSLGSEVGAQHKEDLYNEIRERSRRGAYKPICLHEEAIGWGLIDKIVWQCRRRRKKLLREYFNTSEKGGGEMNSRVLDKKTVWSSNGSSPKMK